MNREQMMSELCGEESRVQYDGKDNDRIFKTAHSFTEASMATLEALAAYQAALDAPLDENAADKMKEARYNVVNAWTIAQAAVSKIAHTLRINGDEAFDIAIKAALKDEEPNLSGL